MRRSLRFALGVAACVLAATVAASAPAAHRAVAGRFEVVRPWAGGAVRLFDLPGGHVIATTSRGVFGGPVVLGVVSTRGPWAEVTSELVPDGVPAWVNLTSVEVSTVGTAIRVQLAARRLEVVRGGRLLRSFRVAVGAPGSPTPTGRYAVAEKLPGRAAGSGYGCCVLALTARQETPPGGSTPATWFVAIHGGSGIGSAVSAGCLHLPDAALRYLMRTVPLGAPVFIDR